MSKKEEEREPAGPYLMMRELLAPVRIPREEEEEEAREE